LIWVTWRQHRLEGLGAAILVTLLGAGIYFVSQELSHPACQAGAMAGICTNDAAGRLITWILEIFPAPPSAGESITRPTGWGGLANYGLVALPALAGAFVAAPLIAREFENGTHRLAWTQGFTRMRWLFMKLTFVFVPLLGGAAALGILEVHLIDVTGSQPNHWDLYDQEAPLIIGSTAFALALGVAAGAVLGRSVLAIGVTLIGFSITRNVLAMFVRPAYQSPQLFTTHDPNALDKGMGPDPTAWFLGAPEYHDAAGRALNDSQVRDLLAHTGNQSAVSYFTDHGISLWWYYQPGDRFWTFQAVETTILIVAALLLLGVTAYWVARRAS
jgi:hypothetical protein